MGSRQRRSKPMAALSDEIDSIKFVHTYGVGLHSDDLDPDVHDPRWQRRQVEDFVEFAVLAEELGFDGITVTEHHAPLMTCPSPHLLLAAAAMRTRRIRLGTAVTVLPLYNPIRVAEEAGTLDLLSGGRFELGVGRGTGEVERVSGGAIDAGESMARWIEGVELLHIALTQQDFVFDGAYTKVLHPFSVPTRPLQDPFPVWMGARSLESVERAAEKGWSVFRNVGSDAEHRAALERYVAVGRRYGHALSGANFMIERFIFLGETLD